MLNTISDSVRASCEFIVSIAIISYKVKFIVLIVDVIVCVAD